MNKPDVNERSKEDWRDAYWELYQKLTKLDESPESSVWPGEKKWSDKDIIEFAEWLHTGNGYFMRDTNSWFERNIGYPSEKTTPELLKQWLQSRTAVKAEEYSEKLCNQKEIDLWQRIFDRCKEIYPLKKATDKYIEIVGILKSQPTAGGVKEEYTEEEIENVLYYLHSREDASDKGIYEQLWENQCKTIKEQRKRIKELESQPSPSNPSIKRPTEESFVEYIKKTRGEFSRECQINDWWYSLSAARRVSIEDLLIAYDQMAERLLSIQPDK